MRFSRIKTCLCSAHCGPQTSRRNCFLSEKIHAVGFEAWVGPALADSWHLGRRAQQGQSLERVCPEPARVQPSVCPLVCGCGPMAPLRLASVCTLWLAAASSSLPFPGAAKLLHIFQTLPRPQPLPSSLYLDSPRAKVPEVLALRIPCHLP